MDKAMRGRPTTPLPHADTGRSGDDGFRLRVLIVGPVGFIGDAIRRAIDGAEELLVLGEPIAAGEAESQARELQPDVVLLDADAAGADWRIVVMGLGRLGNNDAGRVLDAVVAGARGYLTKDLSGPALARSIAGIRNGELPMSRTTAAIVVNGLSRNRSNMGEMPDEDIVLGRLTPREYQVLRLVAAGLKDREIADRLSLSVRTVETHVNRILRRLQVPGRSQAAMRYMAAAALDGSNERGGNGRS